jgi:hypothetical protein
VDLIYSLWELIPRRVSDKRDRSGKPKLIDGNNLPDAIASHRYTLSLNRNSLSPLQTGCVSVFPFMQCIKDTPKLKPFSRLQTSFKLYEPIT